MIRKYLSYLKDNPRHYWFKRKLYGWGWTPATKEGWGVTITFIAIIIWIGVSFGQNPDPSNTEITVFLTKVIILAILLVLICYKKGESPRWQWGYPKNINE